MRRTRGEFLDIKFLDTNVPTYPENVKMTDPFYNVNTGDFRGLEKTFSVICVTEDAE